MPLPEGPAAPGRNVAVGASDGEVAFRIHVPHLSGDFQKAWRDFLVSYARALKAKHGDLPIEVENVEGEDWVEVVVRTL